MPLKNRSLFIAVLTFAFCILHLANAQARPRKGFHQGPFITLHSGTMQLDWDVNRRTRVQEGGGIEPTVGLGFGWNIADWLAPELVTRYMTSANEGRREHIGGGNVGFVFTGLFNPLLKSEKFRILPFLKPGFVVQIAGLPGDTDAEDDRVVVSSLGVSIGGGLRFLFNEYLYFGVEASQEFIHHKDKIQLLTPGGNTLIYEGGWKKQWLMSGMVGIHF